MATIVKSKRNGKDITLLNPWEKGNKFFKEKMSGIHITNDGEVKTDKKGNYKRITDTEAAYRSGYLAAQKDARKCFKSKHPRYKAKTPRE